jgi:hypothetical protein
VFRSPRLGAEAVTMQLGAWALQWVSCYVLLVALGLDLDMGAAAAVLEAEPAPVLTRAGRHQWKQLRELIGRDETTQAVGRRRLAK